MRQVKYLAKFEDEEVAQEFAAANNGRVMYKLGIGSYMGVRAGYNVYYVYPKNKRYLKVNYGQTTQKD